MRTIITTAITTALCITLIATAEAQPTRGERALWLGIGYTAFTLYDYLLYPAIAPHGSQDLLLYRVSQLAVQAGLTWLLIDQTDWRTGLAFNLLWWTWWNDFGYYALYEIRTPGTFANEVLANRVTWAWWTPYGLARGNKSKPIEANILITQAGIGGVISFSLILF